VEPEIKYCAFIDVLGYGEFVLNEDRSTEQTIKLLHSQYVNLATHFTLVVPRLNAYYSSDIFLRSFSDSFYMDCSSLEVLLIAVKTIFDYTIGFYASFTETEERTPLLRCGIVKDWLLKFRDIGSMTSSGGELNPVGRAVVRAYQTSEKTWLSGMRIILHPDAFMDLNALESTLPAFPCFAKEVREYGVAMYYYFKHILHDERIERRKGDDDQTDLYELLWPVGRLNDDPAECVTFLRKIKENIPENVIRHHRKTANLFHESFMLSSWRTKNQELYTRLQGELAAMLPVS